MSFCVLSIAMTTCSIIFTEPNAYKPEILSKFTNTRGLPLFQGKIREDETSVRLNPSLKARDNDTVGAASK